VGIQLAGTRIPEAQQFPVVASVGSAVRADSIRSPTPRVATQDGISSWMRLVAFMHPAEASESATTQAAAFHEFLAFTTSSDVR
jgi:hypothetical protein